MKNKIGLTIICALLLLGITGCSRHQQNETAIQPREKTAFQTSGPWRPTIDIRADVTIVYGVSDSEEMTFEQRVQSGGIRLYHALHDWYRLGRGIIAPISTGNGTGNTLG